jgi:hypothetical protein
MKKIRTLLVIAAALISGNAMAQRIAATEEVKIKAGGTADVEFSIVESEEKVALAEFSLFLPEGITIAQEYDEDEEEYFMLYEANSSMLRTGKTAPHSILITPKTDGSGAIYVLVKNEEGKEFKANTGVYLKITLQADESYAGQNTAEMKEIGLFRLDATQMNTVTEGSFLITAEGDGINNVTLDNLNGDIYNTAGQRVSRTTKGLFIQNGKKVVKK